MRLDMLARRLAAPPKLSAARLHKLVRAAIALALTGDPLEVFTMGAHFETCLSPEDVNFFSVLANAADLNKRVLYAHDHALALHVPVAVLAYDLARRMDTLVATLGSVQPWSRATGTTMARAISSAVSPGSRRWTSSSTRPRRTRCPRA